MTSQTCHRIDLAREQLEMALDAFLERHRFASAITPASAAERVLGQAFWKCRLRHDRGTATRLVSLRNLT